MAEAPVTFDAFARHPSLGEREAAGKLSFRGWQLRFETPEILLEIPLTRLEISVDPATGGQCIDLRDPQEPDWALSTFDPDFLTARPLRQQPHTLHQVQQIQSAGELKRRLKITAVFLSAFALAMLLGSMFLGLMARSLANRIPAQWERQLGDSVLERIQETEVFTPDPKLKARLDQAVAPLIKVIPRPADSLKFHISASPIPNAMALPGGHVIVNAGLLHLAERPEEIAGVIAHELAHLARKHAFRKIISDAGPYLILRVFFRDQSGLLGLLGNSSELLIRQSFSQDFEREADAVGWDYLVAARINPRGMIDMFKKLKLHEDQLGMLDSIPGGFRSHPSTQQRIDKLEARWRKLPDKSGFIDLSQ